MRKVTSNILFRSNRTSLEVVLFSIFLALFVAGCARSSYDAPYPPHESTAPKPQPEPPGAPAPASKAAGFAPLASYAKGTYGDELESKTDANSDADDATREVPGPRMVYYNGFARLRVTDPLDTLDQAVEMATAGGGYVERLGGSSVTVRVPVERFQQMFDALLLLGDVLTKSISAADVTDAYTATDLRLQTARETRSRLMELLARADTEEEKLQLLREIQRLTVDIDRMDAELKTLANLAAYSRITLELQPRTPFQGGQSPDAGSDLTGFRWIYDLSPFRRDLGGRGEFLEFTVPDGMVALARGSRLFNDSRRFVAESADGAVFWACALNNEPHGTTDFWISAIKSRLGPEFSGGDVQTVGEFKILKLEDRSANPYRYQVGVRAEADRLEIVEVYFPAVAQEERYGKQVQQSIGAGAL